VVDCSTWEAETLTYVRAPPRPPLGGASLDDAKARFRSAQPSAGYLTLTDGASAATVRPDR
jgi:hypothetical protein